MAGSTKWKHKHYPLRQEYYEEAARAAVQSWYGEINNYDFKNAKSKNGDKIGHFTQLVWKDSVKLGVGIAKQREGFKVGPPPKGKWTTGLNSHCLFAQLWAF